MFDTTVEQPIPLSLAARETPNRRGSRGINTATIWRWAMRGCRGVRLQTAMIGGIRMTSRESMQRFFQRLTAATDATAPVVRTPKQRETAIRQAERELSEAGI
jgi:Protein of unknown function (DUF1580)